MKDKKKDEKKKNDKLPIKKPKKHTERCSECGKPKNVIGQDEEE